MSKKIRRKALSVSMAGVLLLSAITPMPFSSPLQAAPAAAAPAAIAPAQVTAEWYKSYQTMDGVGAAYAYTDSVHMLQLASAGHQDTVRHLLDLTFSEQKGTGHDIVRVIIGDNGGLTASGATAASPGFNPLTSLLADVNNPGFDIEGNAIPMRGTAGQYGYKIEAENRYYDGNTDSIWPVEPEHAPGTLVPVQDFIWDYPSWNQPVGNDDGGPTNLLSKPGEQPVVIKNSPRTRKELFDIDQVWTMLQAQQYGVKQFYACTWTVPYWMSKSNTNSPSKIIRDDIATIDGKPVKIYYQAYADYLVNYIRGMWEQWGIPITHINPFNEVDLAGGSAAYVTELINGYIGPALKKSMQPGGDLYDIKNPDGKLIDFIPQLAAVDGTNLGASLSRGGEVFSQTDPDNALDKNPYLDVFTTHLYGTVGIGTDENKLYHSGDFSKSPLDYTRDGSKYPEWLNKYKLWQAEFMNQDTGDGSAGAYTQRYGNQNINDAVRWSNLMTNMFTSNPGFNGFVWWSMWDSNGADGSDLIRFVTTNSQQEPGRISTLTGEYRLFKRFYGYGHFSRFMNPGDVRFEVTRVPAPDLNVVGFKNPATGDFSMTVSNANNDDSVQPLEFNLKDFPAGTDSVTVFRTSGSENQKKLGTIPVSGGKFVIDIPSASIVTVVPSKGTFATYQGLDGERDIFSTLEAEGNDNGVPGDSAGQAGRADEAVTLGAGGYLAYNNVNFADGSANGGVVRRHLLYLTAQTKSVQGGKLAAYVLPVGTAAGSSADILSQGTRVAVIPVPANDSYGKFQAMVDTGDLSAYGHKDLYIVAEPNGTEGTITVDRFLFGAGDSDWSAAANNSVVTIPGNLLLNGDFDTATSSNTENWSAGRYNNGSFEPAVTGPVFTADTIQSYSGLSRYLKNNSTSKVAGSGKLAGRISAAEQYDGIWQDVTGKLSQGESYNFKGYFLSMMSRPDSYDVAAEHPGDVEVALVYYDKDGVQLGMEPINGRDMPEPYAAREAGDPAYWQNGKLIGRILEGGPLALSSFQPVDVKVADWHETPNQPFTYDEPAGTVKVVLAVYAKDANILYADQLSLTPEAVVSRNLFIDGVQPSDFDQSKSEYKYTVTGNAIPKVTAATSDPAEVVSISQAGSAQGTAVVRFIKGEQVKTYKIFFSTNEMVDFSNGLPAGWEVVNPADPQTALRYSADGAELQTLKSDTEYPGSHNMLQLPGSAEGNWTLTAKLTVDQPLNDPSMGENSQVGLGISGTSSGEFYRINARKVSSNIKVNNSGKIGTQSFTNNTNQTNLSGTNYYLRIVKEGNVVQGYFSTNSGSSWTTMGSPSTYTPEFFKAAKVQLYGTNTSAVTDFKVTFSRLTLVKTLGETGEIWPEGSKLEATEVTRTGVTLSWPAAMDHLGVTGYRIYNGINAEPLLVTGIEPVETPNGAVYRYEVSGLLPNTQYTFKVEARDAAGNWSKDGPSAMVTTLPGEDITPPVWAEGSTLAASGITSSGLTLTWSATATDDSGIYGYRITNGTGDQPITVTDAVYTETVTGAVYSYQVTGLQPGTTYSFKVEAGDTGGNWSADGPSVSATTLPAADTTPPVWTEGSMLEASRITASGLTLTWSQAADDTGVTGYRIYKGSEEIAALSGTELRYEVTGLAAGTLYPFSVQAGDEAGNWSKNGPSLSVTTLKDSGIPSEPTPTKTPTPTPSPTVTPTPASTPAPISAPGSIPSSAPTPTPVPGTVGSPAPSPAVTPGPSPAPVSPFRDVQAKYSWASEAIDTLYGLGIITGTSGTTFSPEKNITRADFVLMLVRALGLEAEAGAQANSSFTDVQRGAYYYEALGIAKKLGIIQGVDGSRFNPKSEITRQDMMVIAAKALKVVNKLTVSGSAGDLSSYSDRKEVAKYAVDSVAALVRAGIVQGDGTSIHPDAATTRAEAAVMIFRILKK